MAMARSTNGEFSMLFGLKNNGKFWKFLANMYGLISGFMGEISVN
jgi:hypothetical protein